MATNPLVEEIEYLGTCKMSIYDFTRRVKDIGCDTVVLPGDIATADVRLDGSRCFVETSGSYVISARCG